MSDYAPYIKQNEELIKMLAKANERNNLVKEALEQALAYFDSRSDADCDGDPPQFRPNQEMRLAMLVQDALNTLKE